MEKQKEIVEYLDYIYEKSIKTSNGKINELKQLNQYCINNQKLYGKNIKKTLGEVCNFKNGKAIKKDNLIEGNYPVIGGGQSPMGYHNEYNTNENTILCSSSGAYAGYISKYNIKVWTSDCFSIIPNNSEINNTYLFYYLKNIQHKIYELQTGTAQPHIYSSIINKLEIPISSIEKQNEIVAYCEHNDSLIKQLENEIENNKLQAKQFLDMVLDINSNDEIPSTNHEKTFDEQIEEHKSTSNPITPTDTTSTTSTSSRSSRSGLTVDKLKEMCKQRKITGYSNINKTDLAKKLLEYHNNETRKASSSYIPLTDNELSEINKIIASL